MDSTTYGVTMIVLGLVIALCSIATETRTVSDRVGGAIIAVCGVVIAVCGLLAI